MAAQQRLSELRAEIAVAEQEVQAACSAVVAPASMHALAPPLAAAAAEGREDLGLLWPSRALTQPLLAGWAGDGRRRVRPLSRPHKPLHKRCATTAPLRLAWRQRALLEQGLGP